MAEWVDGRMDEWKAGWAKLDRCVGWAGCTSGWRDGWGRWGEVEELDGTRVGGYMNK